MAEDPFDEIDDYSDREGDPFDELEDPDDAAEEATTEAGPESAGDDSHPPADQDAPGTADSGGSRTADPAGSDPFEYFGEGTDRPDSQAGADTGGGADGGHGSGAEDGHGSGAEDGHGSGTEGGAAAGRDGDPGRNVDVVADPFGDVDVSRGDPFESADSPFQQVDVDRVDPDAVWARFTEGAEPAEAAEPAGEAEASLGGEEVPEDASDVVTVPKGRFCQTCPHFSDPPEATCGHDGTELLTFVGTDEVRVSNCPIVRERRELGETFE